MYGHMLLKVSLLSPMLICNTSLPLSLAHRVKEQLQYRNSPVGRQCSVQGWSIQISLGISHVQDVQPPSPLWIGQKTTDRKVRNVYQINALLYPHIILCHSFWGILWCELCALSGSIYVLNVFCVMCNSKRIQFNHMLNDNIVFWFC